jgi:hypothetical protein
MIMIKQTIIGFSLLALLGCQAQQKTAQRDVSDANVNAPAADQFMANLLELCGKSYTGKVISTEAVDADWAKEVLTIYVSDCSASEISIPLHVGENRSRTWVFSKTASGLRLKHDHRHEDGTSDAVTMYGGDTATPGTAQTQSFPVDAESIALFKKEDLTASVTNVWSVTHIPGETFTYELKRPGRLFQAQFDLTKTTATPPSAWGFE